MDETLTIAPAKATESEAYAFAKFVVAHAAESGKSGAPFYSVMAKVDIEEVESAALARWSRRLNEPNWGRAMLLWASDPRRVVGHAELRGGRVPAEMHRATFAMGLATSVRGRGWGRKLAEASLAFAKDTAKLTFVDLGVFAHNTPALALYEKLGFVETGRRADAFRIEGFGETIDIMMTLDLREYRPSDGVAG